MTKLLIVGGGRMGEALLAGLLRAAWATPAEFAVAEAVPERRAELAAVYPGVSVVDEAVPADGALIAVKPKDVAEVCGRLRSPRVLSIAAGVPIATIEGATGPGVAVVRAMPNTPLQVGEGASAIAGGTVATDDDLAWAEAILGPMGLVVRVPEPLLDAVTGLSGSGPAYVFLVAEAMRDAGAAAGLPADIAAALAAQTLLGAARLLASTGDEPETLRAQVTTPGGTTEAGLRVLEAAGLRQAFRDAVAAATERSKQLGR